MTPQPAEGGLYWWEMKTIELMLLILQSVRLRVRPVPIPLSMPCFQVFRLPFERRVGGLQFYPEATEHKWRWEHIDSGNHGVVSSEEEAMDNIAELERPRA